MDLSANLLRTYRETAFKVMLGLEGIPFRVGVPAPELDAFLAGHGAVTAGFITAWNPLSEIRPLGENRRMQWHLRKSVNDLGLTYFSGVGENDSVDPPWREPSLLVVGITIDKLIMLATAYRQHATIWIEAGKEPELLITPFSVESTDHKYPYGHSNRHQPDRD